MEARFNRAKMYLLFGDLCNLPVVLLAVVFAFAGNNADTISLWAGIASALLVTAQQLLMVRYGANYGLGEALRRKLHLADGLGTQLSYSELAELRVRTSGRAPSSKPPYYRSTCPPGVRRLMETVLESAFWSEHLHQKEAGLYLSVAVVSSILFFVVVLVLAVFGYARGNPNAGRVVLAALMLLTEFNIWERWWSHSQSHLELDRISNAAQTILMGTKEVTQHDTIRLFASYSAVVLNSYPISGAVYRCHHDLLEQEWQKIDEELVEQFRGSPAT